MSQTYERTVFVTGGSGFIGSHFLDLVVPLHPDWRFVNIDCLTYAGNEANNNTVSTLPNYIFSATDIRDIAALQTLSAEYQPTHIINFAAESHVDRSIESASIFADTNVVGTTNLLQLAREYQVQRFHQISTDEVYGALGSVDPAFTEQSPLMPTNPYSASKAAADLMVQSFQKTHGVSTIITRSSNIYGPRQDDSKLIPRFVKKMQRGETVTLYGSGEQVREWTYVTDVARALHAVFISGRVGEVYNIGSGVEHSNQTVAETIAAALGADTNLITYGNDRPGHDFRYALNAQKIATELQWAPQVEFTAGIREIIASYQST